MPRVFLWYTVPTRDSVCALPPLMCLSRRDALTSSHYRLVIELSLVVLAVAREMRKAIRQGR
jgi:hypothetical protein